MRRIVTAAVLYSLLHAAPPSLPGRLEKIAVLNLKDTEGVSRDEAELLSDRLRNELFSTGSVEVMERDQMQAVLAEQGFQQSGATCSDEGCMVEVGKLLGVKLLISGSIGKLGRLYMINVKSIDVETARIIKVVSEDIRGDIEEVVEILPAIAHKLTGCSPGGREKSVVKSLGKSNAGDRSAEKRARENKTATVEPLPCDGTVYVERIRLPKSVIGFSIDPSDEQDIDDMLVDAFEESLDGNTVSVPFEQLANASCKALTIRMIPKSYTTKTARMKQFAGTMKMEVALFASPAEKRPLITVLITKTGDRHWGDITPLKNAFEEIAEAIEEEFYSKVKKTLSNAGL
ncbi:MAG: DUF2380 domain-containing protein [Chitinispirillaceae bacterium]|nr:DUF2380 domain-containing protein [Chitinispirillaceae bacterium]